MNISNDLLVEMIREKDLNKEAFAKYFDNTLLDDAVPLLSKKITKFWQQSVTYAQQVKAVCVNPKHIPYISELLAHFDINPCTVIDFPYGLSTISCKVNETITLESRGAKEFDYVLNIEKILKNDLRYIEAEINACIMAAMPLTETFLNSLNLKQFGIFSKYLGHLRLDETDDSNENLTVKFIIEAGRLNDTQKKIVSGYIKKAGLSLGVGYDNLFVKTSTGKYKEDGKVKGATIEDVMLLKESIHPYKVKAAGGIDTIKKALSMIYAGTDRIGSSSSYKIINDFDEFVEKFDKEIIHPQS